MHLGFCADPINPLRENEGAGSLVESRAFGDGVKNANDSEGVDGEGWTLLSGAWESGP